MSASKSQDDELLITKASLQKMPFLRILACGIIVFMVYFAITSWRSNGNFDVPRVALRFALHLILPMLATWYLTRSKAWSTVQTTGFLIVSSAGLLLVTGLIANLNNGPTVEEQDRLMSKMVDKINDFSTTLESVSDRTSGQVALTQLHELNDNVQIMISEINQLPELTEWHASKLQKKYAPVYLRIQMRLELAMDDLIKKGIDTNALRKGVAILYEFLKECQTQH